ncbi:zinc finger protein 2-like isoform X3 [Armigeres subalbatus]|uniref:zinc finger protein 2-like isoform X3 n=1 Tax=Armigeres subalbatus TaxID=124917 RepID=UPI002ED4FBCE
MNQNGTLGLEHLQLPSASSTAYCRLCLARDNLVELSPCHPPSLSSSFLSDDESSATQAVRLIELIFECTDVRLSPEHETSCAVCQPCKRSLMEFYRFRARAKRVDELIKSSQLTSETDKTEHEETQTVAENNQFEEPMNKPLDQSKETLVNVDVHTGDSQITTSTNNHKKPSKVTGETRKRPLLLGELRPSGDFLAVGVKRPRPKLIPTPVIIASVSATGGGKYRCRYCPKSFKTAAGLTEHSRNHNRPHQCPNCLEQFQHAPSLARHIRNRTCFTFTKYRCRVCTESFLEQTDWAEHIKIHADDFPYQCQECLSQFKHKATLRRHVNTVHLLQY